MVDIKKKTIYGLFWSSVERFSVQGIQFILGLIMARLLSPKEFGIVGMLTIFLAVADAFVNSGFSNALIQKKDRERIDFSTTFYFNFVLGSVAYAILFIFAPLIANFYNEPILDNLIKVVGINVFINSLAIVQRAIYVINVDFKTQAKASLVSVIISGIVGVWLAYNGWGVWSLAYQNVLRNVINTILLWLLSKWLPKLEFSWKSFKQLFNFGYKLLLSGLIDTIYNNIYSLVIGKVYSARDLGNYTRAQQFAFFPSSNLTGVLQSVTFPILSSLQDDDKQLENLYRKYIRMSAFVIFPLMMGLAVLSKPLILVLLTDKWIEVVPLLQLMCFSMMWYPIHALNLNLLQVKGRSDLFLKLEIIKKIIGVVILCITIPISVTAMVVGSIISSILALIVNTYYTGLLINVGFLMQMRDILPTLLLSFTMVLIVGVSVYFITSNIVKLIVGVIVGVFFYYFLARLFNMPELSLLMSLFKKNKNNNG